MGDAAKSIPTIAAQVVDSIVQWDFETDIAVTGFGGAGACAAIEAADAGAEVSTI